MNLPDLLPEVNDFLKRLIGPSADELGLLLGDKVKLLRLKSSIKVYNRAKELLKEAGFSEPKPVDLKTLVPLLEYCSLEKENSELIEKWAGLLSSASSYGLKTYTYPHMLNQLSPNEVNILDMLYQNYSNTRIELDIEWLSRDIICSKLNITNDDIIIYLGNLFRLGLCRSSFGSVIDQVITESDILYGDCTLTPLGIDFVRACKGPDNIK